MPTYSKTISQTLQVRLDRDMHITHSGSNQSQTYLTDGVLNPVDAWKFKVKTILSQNLTVAPTDVRVYHWGRILSQRFTIHPTNAETMHYKVTDAEVIHLASALVRAFPATLSQNLTAHHAQVVALGLTVLQRLKLIEALSPSNRYHLTLAQAILLNSALARFMSLSLSQALTVHPVQSYHYVTSPVLSQALTVHGALTNTLMLSFNDTIGLDDDQVISMIYRGDALLDTINLSALYISPAGTVTTWAINTRTNAITEYMNYNFNSFASFGKLRYIATAPDGIYELDGDDDNGASIIADVISGFAQLNATKLSGLKGVYLAIRGQGEYFLKLITGDERVYTYQLQSQPGLMSTKVDVGKGLRTRYLAFELISSGQDFDLDTLEFVPMLSDRRV